MARTKDAVLAPEQKALMDKEYLDFVNPSTYGNKANPSSCNSLYDNVENFNAAGAKIIIKGVSVHTGYAKGKMVNASRLAVEFQDHSCCRYDSSTKCE